MAEFLCKTRDASGKAVECNIDAESVRDAMLLLEEDGLFPVQITPRDTSPQEDEEEAAGQAEAPAEGPKSRPTRLGRGANRGFKVGRRDVMQFSIQLNSSLDAGIPMLQAIRSCRDMTRNLVLKEVLDRVSQDIEGGLTLSDAMRKYPGAFPHAYVGTIGAGERSGTLGEMLENLADFLEADLEVRADIRSAILYPAIVVVTLCLAVVVLVAFVVPRFASFYSGFGSELPLATRALLGFSAFMGDHYLLLIGALGLAAYAAHRTLKIPKVAEARDRMVLRIPVFGRLIETSFTLQVVQLIGLFTKAGVPILEAVRTASSTVTNRKYRKDLDQVADGISTGRSFASGLEEAQVFPPEARHMLANGETTGSMERACDTTAKRYRKELRYMTRTLATLIEPMLTLALAVIVLFIALAVFLPMWDLVSVVGK